MQRLPLCPVIEVRTGAAGLCRDLASQERWQVWKDEAGFSGRPAGLQLWALVGRTGLLGSGNKLGGRSGLCRDSTKKPKKAGGLDLI